MKKNTLKKIMLSFLLVELIFSYGPVYAQATEYNYAESAGVSAQIAKYLCAPTEVEKSQNDPTTGTFKGLSDYQVSAAARNVNSQDLFRCINQLYKFAIVLASVVGVFFIVVAGFIYMSAEGNSESVDKAKNILVTTITSLVILFGGYILLKAINPDLIELRSVQPPSVLLDTSAWSSYKTPTEAGAKDDKYTNKCVTDSGVGVCSNCKDYSENGLKPANGTEKPGCNTFLNSGLISKLNNAKSNYPSLAVTEAFPPTVSHLDSCHNSGTCVDIVPSARTAAEFDKLCSAIKTAGLQIYNESGFTTTNCGQTRSPETNTGPHLHVY